MNMKMKSLLAMGLLAAFSVQAQNTYRSWEGGSNDNFMVAANWQDDIIPTGAVATARIWLSTGSTPAVSNNTVLYSGDAASLNNVWIGNSNDADQSGDLTIQSGASLTTTDNFILNNNSKLTSSGVISVGNVNGIIAKDSSSVTLENGATLNTLSLQNNSTGTLEGGSSVTLIKALAHSSHINLNNSYTGNLTLNNTSSASIGGTLDGNLQLQSTTMSYIGASGTVDGDVQVSTGDQLTVAGTITNGVFYVNQTGVAVIEATARVYSDSNNSWLYNDASVTWNVGTNGSVGTLWADRDGDGVYDDLWRYTDSTNLTVVLDDYDSATYGDVLTLRLVSGIEQEGNFTNNVTFLLEGAEVTNFVYGGSGTFIGTLGSSLDPAPIANPDSYNVYGGLVLNVSEASGVLDNDIYVGSEILSAMLSVDVANGSLILNADGSFTYTPTPGFIGTDGFTYQAYTPTGTSDVAQVTIHVDDPEDSLVANPDAYTVPPDELTSISDVEGVLVNDVYVGGLTLSAQLVDTTTNGVLSLNADGSFTYTPGAGFIGMDGFTYKAYTSATTSDVAEVAITVNDPDVTKILLESDVAGDGITAISVVAGFNEVDLPLAETHLIGTVAGDSWGGTGLNIGGSAVTFTTTQITSYSGTVYTVSNNSPIFVVNNEGLGIRSSEGGNWWFIDGQESFTWKADKMLSLEGLGLRNGWAGNTGNRSFTIASSEWIGLVGVVPGTGVAFDGATGTFSITNVSGNVATDDNLLSLTDLVGEAGPDLTFGTASDITIASTTPIGIEGFSFSFVSFRAGPTNFPSPELGYGMTQGGDLVLAWTGTIGATYAVQSTENLVFGEWTNTITGLSGPTISVTNSTTQPQEFFRVIVE